MHHLLAFGSASLDSSAGDVQLPAIADQIFTRSNNNFQIPREHHLLWAYAGGVGLTRARFRTGSLQSKGYPQIFPVSATVVQPSPFKVTRYLDWPVLLRKEEDLRVDTTTAAAVQQAAFLAIAPAPINYNINVRDLRLIRFTATCTMVADAWAAPVAITFQDTLEGGTYYVYGMSVQSADCAAARLVFPDTQLMRPGCLVQAAVTNIIDYDLFHGGLGKWGEFTTYAQPQLECYGTVAGAENIAGVMLVGKP